MPFLCCVSEESHTPPAFPLRHLDKLPLRKRILHHPPLLYYKLSHDWSSVLAASAVLAPANRSHFSRSLLLTRSAYSS